MIKAKIIKDDDSIEYQPILGGDPVPKRWRKYLRLWHSRDHIIAVKNAIIDGDLVGVEAWKISDEILFEFSDGSKPWGFSMRAWGDLMDAIIGEKRGYMYYYC
jgi:hypothetical protein